MNQQPTATELQQAAAQFSQRGARINAAQCADLATKLARYGAFRSDRQRAFAAALVAQAGGAPEPTVALHNFDQVKRALDAAHRRGLKRPTMRMNDGTAWFVFKRAPDDGRNPGQIYVNRDYDYVGKIAPDGQFRRGRDCTERDVQVLTIISADPLTAARNSGKLTGQCSCCGRALSDPQSQQDGIGPICKQKYFD